MYIVSTWSFSRGKYVLFPLFNKDVFFFLDNQSRRKKPLKSNHPYST